MARFYDDGDSGGGITDPGTANTDAGDKAGAEATPTGEGEKVEVVEIRDDMTAEGFIALQVHSSGTAGMQVHWKNIKSRELNAQ